MAGQKTISDQGHKVMGRKTTVFLPVLAATRERQTMTQLKVKRKGSPVCIV